MFWNKKKEGSLPELPALRSNRSFPEYPKMKEEKDELPELPEYDEDHNKAKTVEMEEWVPEVQPPMSSEHFMREKPKIKVYEHPHHEHHYPKEIRKEVFVKIDRFRTAKKDLESASERLEEIDNLLRRIRETKMREEQELSAWEKEVATVKSRLQSITENIFEKVE